MTAPIWFLILSIVLLILVITANYGNVGRGTGLAACSILLAASFYQAALPFVAAACLFIAVLVPSVIVLGYLNKR